MNNQFEQISIKKGFMKHNGGVLFKTISATEYEFKTIINENHIIAPVDGKIVIIEEVYEKEYFKDKRLQVSIFMSPINVHVTRYCVSGKIKFSKYHPGKYLVAWHPKSSELNERTAIVIRNNVFGDILYRQVAGCLLYTSDAADE